MQTGLTREAIYAECDQLMLGGATPTLRLLQQRLGGSFTTLKPHLQAWKDAQHSDRASRAAQVPQAALDRGGDLVRLLYADLSKEFVASAERVRAEAAAEIQGVRAEMAEATQEVARLEGLAASQAERVAVLEREVSDARVEVRAETARADAADALARQLRDQLDAAQRRCATLEAQEALASELQQRLGSMEAALRSLQPANPKAS